MKYWLHCQVFNLFSTYISLSGVSGFFLHTRPPSLCTLSTDSGYYIIPHLPRRHLCHMSIKSWVTMMQQWGDMLTCFLVYKRFDVLRWITDKDSMNAADLEYQVDYLIFAWFWYRSCCPQYLLHVYLHIIRPFWTFNEAEIKANWNNFTSHCLLFLTDKAIY